MKPCYLCGRAPCRCQLDLASLRCKFYASLCGPGLRLLGWLPSTYLYVVSA